MTRWQAGKKTPVIDNWPELQPGLEVYLEAFYELCSDRPQAMSGISPIPFTSICKFAEAYGLRGEDFEDLRYFARVLDKAFIEWHEDRRPAKGKQGQVIF